MLGLQSTRLETSPRLDGWVVTSICIVITGNQEMHAGHSQPSQQILMDQGSFWPRLHLVDPGSTVEGGNNSRVLLRAVGLYWG